MSWKWAAVCLVAALAGVLSAAGDQGTGNAVERLRSADAAVRAKAQDEIRSEYNETVQALEALVEETLKDYEEEKVGIAFREGKGYDPKYRPAASAMQLLGDMRAVHAVPLLVRHLDFFCPIREQMLSTGPSPEEIPALGALIKIGLPSVRPVLERHSTEGVPVPVVAYWLVKGVLGGEGIAEAYLTRAVAEEQDPQKRDRLQLLLKGFKGK
jgi:hypothetical protein